MSFSCALLTDRTVAPDSFATALASNVLPVPGGPYSSSPGKRSEAKTPYRNASGLTSDKVVIVWMASIVSKGACTSLKVTDIFDGSITPASNAFSCLVAEERILLRGVSAGSR